MSAVTPRIPTNSGSGGTPVPPLPGQTAGGKAGVSAATRPSPAHHETVPAYGSTDPSLLAACSVPLTASATGGQGRSPNVAAPEPDSALKAPTTATSADGADPPPAPSATYRDDTRVWRADDSHLLAASFPRWLWLLVRTLFGREPS